MATKDKKEEPAAPAPELAQTDTARIPYTPPYTPPCTNLCIDGRPISADNPIPVDSGTVDVALRPSSAEPRKVDVLWQLMRRRAEGFDFNEYKKFADAVLCEPKNTHPPLTKPLATEIPLAFGTDAYELLKTATEAYLLARTPALKDLAKLPGQTDLTTQLAAYLGTGQTALPFIRRITSALTTDTRFFCQDNITASVLDPLFIELIWSYWIEEALVVQAINAISLRFQNKRGPGDRDPLANLEIHYLRPISNILWGYIQDEDHRLTVARRAYEYEHQYGLTLVGKAVPQLRPADRRSTFLAAFHTLLHEAAVYHDRSSNLTVRPEAFPLLNALREVHLILAEGAHNQFRDLAWTARVEMLIQQWILSRREIREFIGGRQAVPYAEDWMSPVDALRKLMGWGDVSTTHFRDLAVNGEQILLSIRFGDWSVSNDEEEARGWVQAYKADILRYIHAYQTVTGVDLRAMSADRQVARQINAVPPSVLLQQRLARAKARG